MNARSEASTVAELVCYHVTKPVWASSLSRDDDDDDDDQHGAAIAAISS